jgi:hypothetical protein
MGYIHNSYSITPYIVLLKKERKNTHFVGYSIAYVFV